MNSHRNIRLAVVSGLAIAAFAWSVHAGAQSVEGRWIDQEREKLGDRQVRLEINRIGRTWLVSDPSDKFGGADFEVVDADERGIAFKQHEWFMKPAGQAMMRDRPSGAGWNVVCRLGGTDTLVCQSTVFGPAEGLSGGRSSFRRAP